MRPAAVALAILATGCGDNLPAQLGGVDAGSAVDGGTLLNKEMLRAACAFHAGASTADTIDLPGTWPRPLPLTHVIVTVQENHTFDSYFGRLSTTMQPDAEPLPLDFTNVDGAGRTVAPVMRTSSCLNLDPPHQWNDAHLSWNSGRMDGFARSGGASAFVYYDAALMPFYYWFASTFSIADRHFAPVLAGTWANRDYLYAGTSRGVINSFSRTIPDVPTIFDKLSEAGVSWGVYTDGEPFQDTLGWDRMHGSVFTFDQFVDDAAAGTLPFVSFVDPPAFSDEDEHPSGVADLGKGQGWSRDVYQAAVTSPLWGQLVLFLTWDEWGGFFDHVPPPAACAPSADQPDFNRLGFRVAFIAASPWVKPHSVSHIPHSHTSITRFIELLYDLPALTDRDANSDALLDMFDFTTPALMTPPPAPPVNIPPCQ